MAVWSSGMFLWVREVPGSIPRTALLEWRIHGSVPQADLTAPKSWVPRMFALKMSGPEGEEIRRPADLHQTSAEWSRRRLAKPLGSPRAGSKPTGVVCLFAVQVHDCAARLAGVWPLLLENLETKLGSAPGFALCDFKLYPGMLPLVEPG